MKLTRGTINLNTDLPNVFFKSADYHLFLLIGYILKPKDESTLPLYPNATKYPT